MRDVLDATERALRREIADAPDDLAARRVLADHLISRGDPRGELIALHCAPELPADALELGTRALWQRHLDEWRQEDLAGAPAGPHLRLEWRAGLIDEVSATLTDLPHLAELAQTQPVQTLRAIHLTPDLSALAASPLLGKVRRLELSWGMKPSSQKQLAAVLEKATSLRHLKLTLHPKPAEVWAAVKRSPRLAVLESLSLVLVPLPDSAARWLGEACPRLERLRFDRSLGDDAARALAEGPLRLRELELDDFDYDGLEQHQPELDDEVLAQLLASKALARATRLSLHCHPGLRTLEGIAKLPCRESLEELELRSSGSGAVRALAGAALPSLRRLVVRDCQLADRDAELLGRFSGLTHLNASDNPLGPRAVEEVVGRLTRLEALDLDACPIGNDGIAVITKAEGAGLLRRLSLAMSGLRAAAFDALGAAERMCGLRELGLYGNDADRHSVAVLAAGPFDAMARLWVQSKPQDEELFADGWLQMRDWLGGWQRRLELSGRAVARASQRPGARPAPVPGKAYEMRRRYAAGEVIEHPSFGRGQVVNATQDRIDVVFEVAGAKRLVHAKR
jgi:uncharacterized protein (TIGR02996 family)